ncbi:uncharacterized protein LOC127102710 [Lathyrus oleraceus]|uniref:uncharacterized protein LOC127102710 n=1 Tax=Pisum sativum TaxID=3888 RepID=UPI0021CE71FF|nr:uncharacterized protein LOC127102710 [Pisum sativum]
MNNNEKVPNYISRVILITNEMKSYGETLSEERIIDKVLRSLSPQFDYIVVEIEQSKDLSTMRVEELQSSLEAQELRLIERNSEIEKSETSTSEKQKTAQKGKEKYDKRKVQCYCCKKFGHFDADYTGCSNHLIGNEKWLVDFDSRKRTRIRCPDDKYLNVEGTRNVRLVMNNGKTTLIQNLWYVPGRKNNMMSVGQLIENGFFSYYEGQPFEVV